MRGRTFFSHVFTRPMSTNAHDRAPPGAAGDFRANAGGQHAKETHSGDDRCMYARDPRRDGHTGIGPGTVVATDGGRARFRLRHHPAVVERNLGHRQGISDLIVDELVNDGSYRIIERTRLDAILAEQNFSNSNRADPSAADVAKIGKALGVRYMVVGSITKFGTENKQTSVGGGGFGGGGFGLGKVGTSKGKANVAITARMVDTTTGEIMASARGEGTSNRSGLLLGGGGGQWGGAGLGEISMGSSDFRETVLGEATEKAVKDVSTKLVAAKSRLGGDR